MPPVTAQQLIEAKTAEELSTLLENGSQTTVTEIAKENIKNASDFLLKPSKDDQRNIDLLHIALGDEALNVILNRVNNGILDDLKSLEYGQILNLIREAGPEFRSAWQQHYSQNTQAVTSALSNINYDTLGDSAYLAEAATAIMTGPSDIGAILGNESLNLDVMKDLADGKVMKEDGSVIQIEERDIEALFNIVSGVIRNGGGVQELQSAFNEQPALKTRIGGALEQLVKNIDFEKEAQMPAFAKAAQEFRDQNKDAPWWGKAYDTVAVAVTSYGLFTPSPNLGGEGEVDQLVNKAVRDITR